MKMKSIIALLGVCAIACVAKADFLYWQVSGVSPELINAGAEASTTYASADKYARLVATKEGADSVYQYAALNSDYTMSGSMAFDLSSLAPELSQWSFAIELGAESSEHGFDVLGQSSVPVSYGGLSEYIGAGGTVTPPTGSWNGGFIDIPEPTSGMLLLIGGSLLALRRRRK